MDPGSTLNHYTLGPLLGQGGMGEVYHATDTRLGREVALKILPPAFVDDPERLARFRREAQIVASLNHPNVAAIYGLEESEGMNALVLELVPGPTLAERIARGPIPVDEALAIAAQVLEALEAAHESGVVHRDLKPANVKLRQDGTVKVLDFGLAKALEPVGPELSQSPTITAGATRSGVILGTAAYMSPEQARGQAVDQRADVWAFGALLYEMLSGRRAFRGDDVSEVLAAVLRDAPDWEALPAEAPERVRRVLEICLEKDPRRRIRDVSALRLALEGAFQTAAPEQPSRTHRGLRGPLVLGIALVAAAIVAWGLRRDEPGPARVTRAQIPLPPDVHLLGAGQTTWSPVGISADGSTVVFAASHEGRVRLYARPLESSEVRAIEGTEDVVGGFAVAPDGSSVAFYTQDGRLRRVGTRGGVPTLVAEMSPRRASYVLAFQGAAWGMDGRIVFSTSSHSGLMEADVRGGQPRPLTKPDDGQVHFQPAFGTAGRVLMFSVGEPANREGPWVAALSLETGVQRIVTEGASPQLSSTGVLVFERGGVLRAARFDRDRLALVGESMALDEPVGTSIGGVNPHFSISADGSLIYATRPAAQGGRQGAVLVDREGGEERLTLPPSVHVRFAPEGRRIAFLTAIQGDLSSFLRVLDLERGTQVQLTPGTSTIAMPVWSPDGSDIAFSSDLDTGTFNLFVTKADGTAPIERLTRSTRAQFPTSWSPDGRLLVGYECSKDCSIGVLDLEAGTPFEPIPGLEPARHGELSPDGRWLAYESAVAGRSAVFVRPFPDVAVRRWAIDTDGANQPTWRADGRELYYWDSTSGLMAAPVRTDGGFHVEEPRSLFSLERYEFHGGRNYSPAPTGDRFLLLGAEPPRLALAQGWVQDLDRRLAR